ncbi:MAG: hypothetical protein NTZ25_02110 [Candidatus Peregrinibacteria bacterium]|nr:hypothetical protein [Candidatus Peregrinibacteria bacterium]
MEEYVHIEDGHIGGDHGKPNLGERLKYSALLAGTLFASGYIGASVVREKVSEVRISGIRNDLEKKAAGDLAEQIRNKVNLCDSNFDKCDGLVGGLYEEPVSAFEEDDVDAVDKKPGDMDILTNFPAHVKCTATRLACFEAIKTK